MVTYQEVIDLLQVKGIEFKERDDYFGGILISFADKKGETYTFSSIHGHIVGLITNTDKYVWMNEHHKLKFDEDIVIIYSEEYIEGGIIL